MTKLKLRLETAGWVYEEYDLESGPEQNTQLTVKNDKVVFTDKS